MKRLAALLLCGCGAAPVAQPPAVAQAQPEAPPPAPAPQWVRTPPPPPLPRKAMPAPLVSRHTLENGLRVVVVEHHLRPVVTVSFVFPHGALSDAEENLGSTFMAVNLASDYYESMGVNDMPKDERSFRGRVTDLGGAARFEVEADDSIIQIAGYAQDANTYVKMMEDATRKLRHGAWSFKIRRTMALDMYDDIESEDPQALKQELEKAAFGEDHPYAQPIFGTPQTLKELELQEVMDQQHLVFSPAGATLLVVGDVKPAEIFATAQRMFENWEGGNAPVPHVPQPALPKNPREVAFLDRHVASTLLTCATRPLPEVSGSDPALRVLVAAFGQGVANRLMDALREKNGLTYSAFAEVVRRRQASALLACSPVQASRADLGVRVFRAAVQGMRDKPLTDDELKRAKAVLQAQLESSWDDVPRITETWIDALTLGNGTPRVDAERAEIEKVTAAQVQKLSHRLFRLETFRWVVSGERKAAEQAFEVPGYGKLRKFAP